MWHKIFIKAFEISDFVLFLHPQSRKVDAILKFTGVLPEGSGVEHKNVKIITGVAQLVEHWSPKPGVGRSSRSSRA